MSLANTSSRRIGSILVACIFVVKVVPKYYFKIRDDVCGSYHIVYGCGYFKEVDVATEKVMHKREGDVEHEI